MMINILRFLQSDMETPGPFGVFHFVSVLLVVLLTLFLVWRFRNADEKVARRIMLTVWLLMLLGEVYKQIVFTFDVNDNTIVKDFQWYAFPFQFCSTPLYVLPFAIFLKEGRARDCFLSFMAIFSLFGGFAVYCFPADVFIEMIGINIQTMLHHGLQIVIGIYLAVRCHRKLSHRFYLGGLLVLLGLIAVAMAMNIGMYHYFMLNGIDESFNMFFISPYYDCTLPVLSIIYPLVPYAAFLPIYVFGFALVGFLVMSIERGIAHLVLKRGCHVAEK